MTLMRAKKRRKSREYRAVLLLAAVASTTMTPLVATAQQAPVASQDERVVIEDIVVTAQRRESSLQDTPVAVSAVTEKVLVESGARFLEDFSMAVPNLQLPGRTIYNQFPTSIRGISSIDTGVAFDMPVAIYVDGVYTGRQFAVRGALSGVERIEVLRGPQGTLFGRNAAAGAIQIIHKAPSDTFGYSLRGSYGSFDAYTVDASIEGSLSPRVRSIFTAGYQSSDGALFNETRGTEVAGNETYNIGGALEFDITDRLVALLRADWEDSYSNYGTRRLRTTDTGTVIVSGIDSATLEAEQGFSLGRVRNDFLSYVNRDTGGVSLKFVYDFDAFELIFLSAFRYSDFAGQSDTDGTKLHLAENISGGGHDQFSQEVRASSIGGDALQWDAGLYYYYETPDQIAEITLFAPPDYTTPALALSIPAENDLDSYAGFLHASYRLTERLDISAGARYTYEEKTLTQGATTLSGDWSAWTPKFGVTFYVSDNILSYVSASRGFKSGGFNIFPPETFGTEDVWAYEAGLKGDFLDNRLRINVAAFFEQYDGLQVTVSTGAATTKTSNADTEISGVELEWVALPFESVTLSGNLAYLDATYENYIFSETPLVDFSGNRVPRSSEWTGNLALEFRHPVGELGDGALRINYSRESSMPMNDANSPALIRPAVDFIDLRVSLDTRDDHWQIAAYGRNLTDEDYIGVVQFLFGAPVGFPNENKRRYGVEVSYQY